MVTKLLLPKTKSIPDTELGWMAGVIDYKGRLAYKKNMLRKTQQTVLYVESKNVEVIKRMAKLTSTKPDAQMEKPMKEWMRRGCDLHCPTQHIHSAYGDPSMPSMLRWTITGAGIVVIMHSLLHILTEENQTKFGGTVDQIILDTPLIGQGSGMVVTSIRRLANNGWPIPPYYSSAME